MNPSPTKPPAWIELRRAEIDACIDKFVQRRLPDAPNTRLPEAVRYSLTGGGKRLRAIVCLEWCTACGGDAEMAVPAAVALECLHAFSLVHDDLPAMDDDALRRGRPTNHRVFGEALAILAGDWLMAEAFRILSEDWRGADRGAGCSVLASGALGMIYGQALDIENEGRPADAALVDAIHTHKTACLIQAACELGALSAPRPKRAEASRYGRHLGVAFQIADDLLDATGRTESLGKQTNKDAGALKQTTVAVHGVEGSQRRLENETQGAVSCARALGEAGARLEELAWFAMRRTH